MVLISRVRVGWSGWAGAPGVSTFYTAAPPTGAQLTAIKTLFFNLSNLIPSGIITQVENSGQQIDTATGKAVDTWTAAAVTSSVGTGGGNYSGPCGGMIRWNTGVFTSGRLLRGKTFLVPLTAGAYDGSGTITDSSVATANAQIATFITAMSGGLAIYSRRYLTSTTATSGALQDKAVVLRSRRS